MPLPDRPVSHASIESVWGQQIHDYTFAPSGCIASGGAITVNDASDQQLPIDTAVHDPGGYVDVALNRIVIPTGGEGLYLINCTFGGDNGAINSETRGIIFVNGANASSTLEQNEAGIGIQWSAITILGLVAGDVLTFAARLRHDAGANPDVNIANVTIVRLGAELGA